MSIKVKMLGRDTLDGLKAHVDSTSNHYKYKDAFTEQPITSNDVYDKSNLIPFNARMSAGGYEYDSIVVEFSDSKNLDEEVKAVIDSYKNPDFIWEKDPGGGRAIQKIHVNGFRPTYYDIHTEANGVTHLHLKVFRYGIDANNKVSSAPNEINRVQEAQEIYINKILDERALGNSVSVLNASTNGNQRASQETKAQIQEFMQSKTNNIDIALNSVIESTTVDEKMLDNSLVKAQKELQVMLEGIKAKQNEVNKIKEAQNVLQENRQLQSKVKALEETKETLTKEKATLETTIIDITEKHIEKESTLQNKILNIEDDLRTSKEEYKELEEIHKDEISIKEEQLEQKDKLLEKQKQDIEQKEKDLLIKESQLETAIKEIDRKNATIDSLNAQNKGLIAQNDNLLATNKSITEQLKDLQATITKQAQEFEQKLKDEVKKAIEETTNKFTEKVQLLEKSVVNAVSEIKKLQEKVKAKVSTKKDKILTAKDILAPDSKTTTKAEKEEHIDKMKKLLEETEKKEDDKKDDGLNSNNSNAPKPKK